jgi:hypothetical protein
MRLLTLFLLITTTLPAIADEGIYRWTDGKGHTYYGNEPPDGVKAERLRLSLQPATVKAGQQVYMWTDEQGNTHYGDSHPADVQAQQVNTDKMLSTIGSSVRSGEKQLLHQLERQNQ